MLGLSRAGRPGGKAPGRSDSEGLSGFMQPVGSRLGVRKGAQMGGPFTAPDGPSTIRGCWSASWRVDPRHVRALMGAHFSESPPSA